MPNKDDWPRIADVLPSWPWQNWALLVGVSVTSAAFESAYRIASRLQHSGNPVIVAREVKYGLLDYRVLSPQALDHIHSLLTRVTKLTDSFSTAMDLHGSRAIKSRSPSSSLKNANKFARKIVRYNRKINKPIRAFLEQKAIFIDGYRMMINAGDPLAVDAFPEFAQGAKAAVEGMGGFKNSVDDIIDMNLSRSITKSSNQLSAQLRELLQALQDIEVFAQDVIESTQDGRH